ncbi:MAG: histidine phosphatase family protein [Nanoarchaeota archaeon]|nr:histidine phosphatase family protein [Nanoarchaeota archaeon]
MITIIFEAHGTTTDNETHRASGHFDVELSELGIKQAKELGERRAKENFDAVFCSDLRRSFRTAETAFAGRNFKIIKDSRLRECDYGDLTRQPSEIVDEEKRNHIETPFPNGESYEQAAERMKSFLQDLLKNYDGKKILIIGHRATQYGLERWIKGVSLKEAVSAKWKWEPGWKYEFEKLKK